MTKCPSLATLAPFIESLDGNEAADVELWLDEKNNNIAANAERYRSCSLNHALLVRYIQRLPEP